MSNYEFVAAMMLKYDSNLATTRDIIVPENVTEDEFWRNYFYHVEMIKKDLGLPHRLGRQMFEDDKEKLAKA